MTNKKKKQKDAKNNIFFHVKKAINEKMLLLSQFDISMILKVKLNQSHSQSLHLNMLQV